MLELLTYLTDIPKPLPQSLTDASELRQTPLGLVAFQEGCKVFTCFVATYKSVGAEDYLLEAIRISPDPAYHTKLAYVYSAQKRFDEALEMIEKAEELGETEASVHLARSDVFIARS